MNAYIAPEKISYGQNQVRIYSEERYENGDKVFYRCKKYKGWKGPTVVLGQNGWFVLVRHISAHYRKHPSHLMKVVKSGSQSKKRKNIKAESLHVSKGLCAPNHNLFDKVSKSDAIPFSEEEVVKENKEDCEEALSDGQEEFIQEAVEVGIQELDNQEERNGESNWKWKGEKLLVTVNPKLTFDMETFETNEIRPKSKSYVQYKIRGSWHQARVLSRQPKRTRNYRSWVNVLVWGDSELSSVNWYQVCMWSEANCPESVVYLFVTEELSQEVVDTKERELNRLMENRVFEQVPSEGQSTVSSKWLITEKYKNGEKITKARLVARGFEEDSSQMRTDSPTCSRQSSRLALTIAVSNSWKINSLDISVTFFQGERR